MGDRGQLVDLLFRIWPSVVWRVGDEQIEAMVAEDGEHVLVKVGEEWKFVWLSDETLSDYLNAQDRSQQQARAREIEDNLVEQIEKLLGPEMQ